MNKITATDDKLLQILDEVADRNITPDEAYGLVVAYFDSQLLELLNPPKGSK